MEDGVMDSRLQSRFERYCLETEAIQVKLQNGSIPQGKREKLAYRLNDLECRLIPRLVEVIQR